MAEFQCALPENSSNNALTVTLCAKPWFFERRGAPIFIAARGVCRVVLLFFSLSHALVELIRLFLGPCV